MLVFALGGGLLTGFGGVDYCASVHTGRWSAYRVLGGGLLC